MRRALLLALLALPLLLASPAAAQDLSLSLGDGDSLAGRSLLII